MFDVHSHRASGVLRLGRVLPATAAAVMLLAAGLVAVAGAPRANAEATIPTWPPPAVPAQQPALTMNCPAGGIDLNHATVAQLQQLPGVAAPIAERIVATRPHDRVEDLLVVPGVGPGKLAEIQATQTACATPLTVPPPLAANPCTSGQLDVNSEASQSGLAQLFGEPTAGRLVAARPFPDLAHARTVLVAGAGQGKVDKYASRLCVTPVPKIHAGTQYGWIYRGSGGRNDYDGATLVVPANVLTDPAGAWSSITPLPVDDLTSGPRFDIHLHGGWADGTKRVFVALPPDPFTPPIGSGDWIPTIVHGPHGSQEVHARQGLSVTPDGRIATTVTHLSPLTSVMQPAQHFAFVAPVVVLPKSTVLDTVVDDAVKNSGDPAECAPDITARTDAVHVGSDAPVLLTGHGPLRAPARPCVQGDLRTNQVTVKLTNTSALAYQVTPQADNPADIVAATYTSDVGILTRLLLDRTNATIRPGEDGFNPRHAKGTVLQFTVPLGADTSYYQFDYDPVLTTATVLTQKVDQIPGLANIGEFVNCFSALAYGDISVGSIVGCAELAAVSRPAARKLLASVGRLLDIFDLGQSLVEVTAAAVTRLGIGTDLSGEITLKYVITAKPVIDSTGRFVPAHCFVADGALWKVDEACFQAWLSSQAPPPADCATNPQCQPQTNPGTPPDNSGCWQYDQLAGAWVLDASAGQGCLLLQPGQVFCGVGQCVPWPAASNKVVEISDGRSFFIDARGGLWHLATTDAYFSCKNKFSLLANLNTTSGKWLPDNLNSYQFQGNRYGC